MQERETELASSPRERGSADPIPSGHHILAMFSPRRRGP
ncbi:hypothetical protein KCH_77000 [Kitasatospora cheerisanensis KCTC 2395]|uniref:Uncharacterized protein n=1 Tax=Kitasatospora cheerisanensis KCTC 2395 TaxID=1348663 RepID=A0A066YGC8_9ACTN|nr:hypothetical protein KCH_77000 [Kitasatospora cheerisanensis KCTC 2395]